MTHDIETVRICVAAFLRHIREIEDERMALEEEMARLESSLSLGAIRYSDMPKAKSSDDQMAAGIARLLELRDKWSGIVNDAYREHGEAMAFCYMNLDRRMCWMFWMEGRTLQSIASQMHYSTKSIMRHRDKGALEIFAWMPEEYRRCTIPQAQPWEEDGTPVSHILR